MLNQLKNWAKRMSSRKLSANSSDLEATIYDPRELPRPLRPAIAGYTSVQASHSLKTHESADHVNCCVNCRMVREELGECVVCWEALRGAGPVLACSSCYKLICGECAPHLANTCPFCRALLPYDHKINGPLERLIRFLDLPTRVTHTSQNTSLKRSSSESQLLCPFNKVSSCTWRGSTNKFSFHLENIHSTQIIENDAFFISIPDVMSQNLSNMFWSVVLQYNGDYFLCQVKMVNNQQIGLTFIAKPKQSFGVLVEIKGENRILRGIVFLPPSKVLKNKEFNFSWNRIISRNSPKRELLFNFKIKPM